MLATYKAIDGYDINQGSIIATLMADSSANMITDRVGSSPLNTLTENGTITYSAVATNATALWASDFSASNYFSLPYTSALDPNTNGVSYKLWFEAPNGSLSSNNRLISRDGVSSPIGAYFKTLINSTSENLITYFSDGSNQCLIASPDTYVNGGVFMLTCTFDGSSGKGTVYINGEPVATTTNNSVGSLSNASAILAIGTEYDGGSGFEGKIAGVEIEIGSVWTAEEIREKYEKEKVLFQQDELFSIVGEELTYESDLIMPSNRSYQFNSSYNPTLSGSRSGSTKRRKRTYDCNVKPFLDASLPNALKFIKSCNKQDFTFDLKGTSSASNDPFTAHKVSRNEIVSFNNPYHRFSFSVRER